MKPSPPAPHIPRIAILLWIGGLLAAGWTGALTRNLEDGWVAWLFRTRGVRESRPSTTVIRLDPETEAHWPEMRLRWGPHLAKIAQIALANGAKGVLIDISIEGQSGLSPSDPISQSLSALGESIAKANGKVILARSDRAQMPAELEFPAGEANAIASASVFRDNGRLYVCQAHVFGSAVPEGPNLVWSGVHFLEPGRSTREDRAFEINYVGREPDGMSGYLVAELSPSQAQALFKDRVVIIGSTEPRDDIHPTPFHSKESGVLILADAIRTLIDRREMSTLPNSLCLVAAAAFALPLGFWAQFGVRLGLALVLSLFATTAWLVVGFIAFQRDWILPTIAPILLIGLGVGPIFAFRAWSEQAATYRMRALMGSFLADQVRNAVLLTPDLQITRDATVMFVDLRESTRIGEDRSPAEFASVISTVVGSLMDIVTEQGGVVISFTGDGFLATFGGMTDTPDHSTKALDAARNLLETDVLRGQGSEDPLRIGIGIHSGEVFFGTIGQGKRRSFNVVGDVVNTAARIQDRCRDLGFSILVSQSTYELFSREIAMEGPIDLDLRNKKRTVAVMGYRPYQPERARSEDTI